MHNFLKKISFSCFLSPKIFFLTTSLLVGFIILFITPPYQSPDEINHFYRALQISNGELIPIEKDDRLGGYIPKSIVKSTYPFLKLRWNSNSKLKRETITNQLNDSLNIDEQVFVDFPNTALYSPTSYLPQSLSIFILKKFNCSPLIIFYGTRVFTLLFWIASIFMIINIIPIYKWLITFLALLPMSLFVNMSISADVVTNVLAFFIIAYSIKLAFSEKPISTKNYLILILTTILIASAKMVYLPVLLVYLIIPVKKFKNFTAYIISFMTLMMIGITTVALWTNSLNDLYIPYENYNHLYRDSVDLVSCGNIHLQKEYISNNIWETIQVFYHSMTNRISMYGEGYIGTFGWLDTKLPLWTILMSYGIIFFVAIFEKNKLFTFNIFQCLVILFALIGSVVMILLSQHLAWNCVGGSIINNLQGRYFIPVFPLLFILFRNKIEIKQDIVKWSLATATLIILTTSVNTIYTRYYLHKEFEKPLVIKCGTEEIIDESYFKTSVPSIKLENTNTQNSEYSRSGKYSVKLNSNQPFGLTYRYYGGNKNDLITAEVWKLGEAGSLVISAPGIYLKSEKVIDTDSNGWEKLQINYKVKEDIRGEEIGFYIYNDSSSESYFDDLKIVIDNTSK